MDQNSASPIFKFVTLRNATGKLKSSPDVNIQPETVFVMGLIEIIESNRTNKEKVEVFNKQLQDFIDSEDFIKRKEDLTKGSNKRSLDVLFNNIIVRILTKSNTNPIYKSIVDDIKQVYLKSKNVVQTKEELSKLKIIIPERLNMSFVSNVVPPKKPVIKIDPNKELIKEITEYQNLSILIKEAKEEKIERFDADGNVLVRNDEFLEINKAFNVPSISIEEAEKKVNQSIIGLKKIIDKEKNFDKTDIKDLKEYQKTVMDLKSKKIDSIDSSKYSKTLNRIAFNPNDLQETQEKINIEIGILEEKQTSMNNAKFELEKNLKKELRERNTSEPIYQRMSKEEFDTKIEYLTNLRNSNKITQEQYDQKLAEWLKLL